MGYIFPFNKPYVTGMEVTYINDVVASGHLSGNGKYTRLCQKYLEEQMGFKKALLTTSCTDALEMCAILMNIQPGDEVIIPSFTFVSTALAFCRQGAKIVFADSRPDHPGMAEDSLEALITDRTKAIVAVHYGGIACDMDNLAALAEKYKLYLVEDAASSIDSYYTRKDGVKRALGTIGHLAAFSFHETKNIQCGEGGFLGINDERFLERAEIIWEKGTNRAEFFRGGVDKYGWLDIGSSFLPSEINAAFLWAQLTDLEKIQFKRKEIWQLYSEKLAVWARDNQIYLPYIPDYATNNGHLFYLVFKTPALRTHLINYLKGKGILSVYHYQSLHRSEYYRQKHDGRNLPEADRYSDCLMRMPFYYELASESIDIIIKVLKEGFIND